MSVRRAVELNFKSRIETAVANSKYKVLESLSSEERPKTYILVMAGMGRNPFSTLPESFGNYEVDLSIIVHSSIDTDTVDEHNNATEMVQQVMAALESRGQSVVQGLYIYDVRKGNVGQENDYPNRKMGSGLNYTVVVNYIP